jgi:hypothetical protein
MVSIHLTENIDPGLLYSVLLDELLQIHRCYGSDSIMLDLNNILNSSTVFGKTPNKTLRRNPSRSTQVVSSRDAYRQTDGLARFKGHSAWLRKSLQRHMDKPSAFNREYSVLIFKVIYLLIFFPLALQPLWALAAF